MQLLRYSNGTFHKISMHKFADQVLTPREVEDCIRRNINMDGSISTLSLDFSGTSVPLVSEEEVRLTACLLCAYHNSILEDREHREHREHREPSLRQEASLDGECRSVCEDEEGTGQSGESDSEDEKGYRASLSFEYELNADIDTDPCFGKAGMEHHLW